MGGPGGTGRGPPGGFSPPEALMSELGDMLDEGRILILDGVEKEEALRRLVDAVARDPRIGDRETLLRAVREREAVMSTAIGLGVAVPHARLATIDDVVLAVAISRKGMDFQAFDDQPVHIVVLVAAPEHGHAEYMKVLARISRALKDDRVRERIVRAETPAEVKRLLAH